MSHSVISRDRIVHLAERPLSHQDPESWEQKALCGAGPDYDATCWSPVSIYHLAAGTRTCRTCKRRNERKAK